MNVTINTSSLAAALRTLDKITPTKAVLPILSHVLIHADVGQVWLSCTDTELSLTRHCNAVTNAAGQIALPCKPLLDIVSQITEPDVHLFVEKTGVRIAAGHFKLRLQALDAAQFPQLSAPTEKGTLINGATLRALLRKVRACISAQEKRYNINGALLVLSEKVLALVTTDGKRLAIATTAHAGTSASQVILPEKLLDRLMQDDSDDYAFSQTDNQLFFATEQSVLSSRKIDGQFPSYQRIIPTANTAIVSASRDALNAALKRVSLVSGDSKSVAFSVSTNMLQLQAKSLELGDAIENVAVEYAGDALRINLQAQAILDFLDASQNATITLALGGPNAAALLSDGADFITVAMAVRG